MKSMKKLVLAGLVLLASVVILAGCDTPLEPESTTVNEQAGGSENDSVPEVTSAKLVSITITPPTRTVYSVGDEFDPTGMVVTATYDDGEPREVTGWTTDFAKVISVKGVNKEVTVSYTEGDNTVTATFTMDVVDPSVPTILTSYISPNHIDDTWNYVAFGEWPQTKANVEGISLQQVVDGRGYFKDNYYTDGKGNYYVKHKSEYYLVEPIVWRVLTKDYPGTGKALLLAEKILIGGILYYSVYNVNREIGGVEIFPNNYEHSQIRAFLNGLNYAYKESDSTEQIQKSEYKDAGFLQTAFTQEAQALISDTMVDNSAAWSTNPDSNASLWNSGINDYLCNDTEDKIFLLSEKEATREVYGFADYDVYVGDSKETTISTRIRVTTDYANATGAQQKESTGYGGSWLLRSPYYSYGFGALCIGNDGNAQSYCIVHLFTGGIVPALCIELQ